MAKNARSGNGPDDAITHIVMFPFLAFGHISPFVQLTRRLVAAGGVRVTFLSAAGNVPRVATLLSSAPSVTVIPLRLPAVPGLPAGAESTADVSADGAELLKIAVDGTKPQVVAHLTDLRPDVVLFDFATPWLPALAAPLGIKSLLFSTFSAVTDAYLVVPARRLHGPNPTTDDLMLAPAGFPPASPLCTVPAYQAANFRYVFTSFHGQPSLFDRVAGCIESCDGIVMKTCTEMEGPYIDYISAQFGKKVLLAGPNVPEPPQGELDEKWAKWLSAFPDGAAVFASFGSEAFLAEEAARELLLGLEMAGYPFLVVFNFPKGADAEEELKKRMPLGFEERVTRRGMVHTGWVQQQHILRHPSVGCFVTHVGLSSVVEGLIAGCRLVMMPQKGDQFLNAALFARELGVGVEVARAEADGRFGREAVRDAVKVVMTAEGEQEGRRWREFLLDDAVQQKFAVEFVGKLKELVMA